MRAIIFEDLITGFAISRTVGREIPAALAGLPAKRLRWDGAQLLDAAAIDGWHIDPAGRKRLASAPDRQPLTCAWNDRLVDDDGTWRVESDVDRVYAAASVKRNTIHAEAARRQPESLKAYPDHERHSFLRQVKEAERYRAEVDPVDAATPLLDAVAERRGLTREAMVTRVETMAEEFAFAFGPLLGAQQALEDQLEAILGDFETGTNTADQALQQIAAIDETDDANWPAAA